MPTDPCWRRDVAAALLVVCLACGGKAPPTVYYLLDLPTPTAAAERLAHTAVLMPIRIGRVVGQGRIVYRESREQVGFYEYHRWAENPEESVARALLAELMARGSFGSIIPFDGRTKADFLIRGELRRLEEIDYDGPVRAAAEIAVELVDVSTGRVVWSGAESSAENVTASEVRLVVSSMSAAVERVVKRLAQRIDHHLRSGNAAERA